MKKELGEKVESHDLSKLLDLFESNERESLILLEKYIVLYYKTLDF